LVRAVKAVVGPEYPVIVRVNGHEYGPEDGLTASETAEAAILIQAAGADAIHVSANAHNPFADFTDGPLPNTIAAYREHTKTIKRAVTIPVVAVGRMLPEVADEMIAAGECDFVSMGRQLLADPDLVNKIRSGERASVRPCINCYVCVEQNFFDGNPKCAVNPALCNEKVALLSPVDRAQHVVIVGAGPAGPGGGPRGGHSRCESDHHRKKRSIGRDHVVLPTDHSGERDVGRLAHPRSAASRRRRSSRHRRRHIR